MLGWPSSSYGIIDLIFVSIASCLIIASTTSSIYITIVRGVAKASTLAVTIVITSITILIASPSLPPSPPQFMFLHCRLSVDILS